MKATFCLTLSLFLPISLLWQVASAGAATPAKTPPSAATVPIAVKLLRDDPLLQAPVTVEAVEQPLGDVLASLSRTLKLNLSAEQNVADQRVTLHISGQPAYVLMSQLLLLFSHDAQHPHGYHWGSLDRVKGERPDYQLWRDTASLAQEQEERDYPRRQLAIMLQDMRHDAQLPTQEGTISPQDAAQQAISADDPYNKAFRNLTDDQISALVNGETVPLDPSLFTAETAALWQSYREGMVQAHLQAVAAGQSDPIPNDPPAPAIRVVSAASDNDEERPDQVGKYDLYLPGIFGDNGYRNLDTYNTPKDPSPILVSLPPDVGPRVDLSPYLAAKTVTPEQKGDLGFTLQALAKAAHLNMYGESFLRTSTLNGGIHPGLDTLQGSVPRLIAQICSVWNYHAQAVPGGYLFWSRTWAEDRAQDVPERLIAPWRQRLKKNGGLSLYDRAEMASSLTWPQVALTLKPALPEAGQENDIYAYRELNLFGSLAPSEQTQVLSPEGLAVSEMSARGQTALASNYRSRLKDIPSDQLMQSALHFRTEDAPELNILRLIMSVDANGRSLLEMRCIMPLKAGEVGKPAL